MDQEYILHLETEKNVLNTAVKAMKKKLSLALTALEAIDDSKRADIAKLALAEIRDIDYSID